MGKLKSSITPKQLFISFSPAFHGLHNSIKNSVFLLEVIKKKRRLHSEHEPTIGIGDIGILICDYCEAKTSQSSRLLIELYLY